jgi:hypothetical protein
MNNTTNAVDKKPLSTLNGQKHLITIEKTYKANQNSDYTEKMIALKKDFDYAQNSEHYWGPIKLSTLYGTPLYEQASESQKLGLNHLYWAGQYSHLASAELNTILYNQVTAGVFKKLKGYKILGQELYIETEQEKEHIRTFQYIGYNTNVSLLGKKAVGNSLSKHAANSVKFKRFLTQSSLDNLIDSYQDSALRLVTKLFLKDNRQYYSHYLQAQESNSIPISNGGVIGLLGSPGWLKFLTLNWGGSPFLAAQYYSLRMIANMSAKAYEYKYHKHFRKLEKQNQYIPTPTAVSHFHFLDESFHTTISQTIARDIYKDFSKPTEYEKIIANLVIYNTQRSLLGGLSGGLPVVFRSDNSFLTFFYRLLKSPLFEMSTDEALIWMEKCLCQEHEGFEANVQHHESLLSDLRRFFSSLDYLWPVNRELKIMASGNSIKKAIANNTKSYNQFVKQLSDKNYGSEPQH